MDLDLWDRFWKEKNLSYIRGNTVYNDVVENVTFANNIIEIVGAPVAQWVKPWPTDIVVPGVSHAQGKKIFSTINRAPLHTDFHYHRPIVLI